MKRLVVQIVFFALLGAGFAAALTAGRWAGGFASTSPSSLGDWPAGEVPPAELLYQVHCARCHGAEGHGDGEAAQVMRPPPRDFAARPWRFEPTAESIRTVLERGIPGTAMPAVGQTLPPAEIDALVEHVLKLSQATDSAPKAAAPENVSALSRAGFVETPNRTAPGLKLGDAEGNELTLEDLRGNVVLLNFWGLGCEHCLARMAKLRDLELKYRPSGLRVISVCIDADDAAQAQEAADRVATGHRVYCDEDGLAIHRFEVQVLPTVWLVDREGKLVGKATGAQDWDRLELAELIDELLAASETDAADSP